MLDRRRVTAQPDEEREQLFTERYESLLAWAMGLTNQRRDAAEDLVQDAFVQFMLGRTRLEEIENIDGYLRRMLRYMHVSRLSRSAQHLHETALSVADYDSGRLGWTAIEPPRRMQAFEELHQICTYACSRKETSRAGSVFILRFFHEYFPTEIAAVLNTSRHCVDEWQRLARREAKLFMNEPRRLRFVNNKISPDQQQIRYLKSDCDLMLELRQMIFTSCKGECLSKSELAEIYTEGQTDALTTAKLAHIVSCHACLDAVNGVLGLPSLANRYRTETHEPKEPPGDATGGGASGGGSDDDLAKKFEHRLRETHEHKPHELRIAVNGTLVSSLKVSSDLSELNLNLTPDDPVEFVEVTSEQGVQLLFFSIDPAVPQPDQWAWIELSEGRSLEACFENENGPTLHMVYKDPVPAEAYITGEISNAVSSSPLHVVPAVESQEPNVGARDGESVLRLWVVRLFNVFGKTAGRRAVANDGLIVSSDEKLISSLEKAPLLGSLSQSDDRRRAWRRLALLIVLVSAVAIGGFLLFKAKVSRVVTASALLERASVFENSEQTGDVVNHRVVTLEERRSPEGAVVGRYRIDIWTNRAKGDRAQRLYDESNRLIAAAWQKSDGSRATYHHGTKPQSQPALTSPETLLFNLDDVWQIEPSSETFAKLIAEPDMADVEERATTYIVTFLKGRMIGASRLVKATLTLNKSNLHAIEQTLVVQRGDDDLREYRFGEASFEPSKTVDPKVFEIESKLSGGAGETGSPGDWAVRDLTNSRVPPTPSTSAPPTASAELEVDVAYLLNQAKADRNEQVTLTRSAGGSLRVEGVVDTTERKEEFLRVLAPVANNPAVTIEIRTVAEATQRRSPNRSIVVQEAEETADTVAAYEDLRAYFLKQDPRGPTDERIRDYSTRVGNRAYRALFRAIELKKLVARFATVDMRTVTPDARSKWLAMVHGHADAFEREVGPLYQELEPVFFPGATVSASEDFVIQSDAELARAVERLHQLALFCNEAVSSALTISSHSSATTIKSTQFRKSLISAENLAKRIGQYER